MSRQSRKIKPRPSKGGIDAITGLKTNFGAYGILDSDKVYGQEIFDKAAGITTLESEKTGESQLEIELSNNRLVMTSIFIANDKSYGGNIYQRLLLTGSFTFKKGALTSAKVDGLASLNYNFNKSGDISLEDTCIESFKEARRISDPHSTDQWNAVLNETGSTIVMYAQRSYPANSADTGRIEDIYGYGGGRIFESNWWQDPFAPNLI